MPNLLTSLWQHWRRRLPSKRVERAWGEPLERERDLSVLDRAYRGRPGTPRSPSAERTWRDLSLGEIYCRIDRCLTTVGQEMLYRRRCEPTLDPTSIAELQRTVSAFEESESLRSETTKALAPLTECHTLAFAPIVYGELPEAPRWARFFRS